VRQSARRLFAESAMPYLWIKALHVVFVVTWFAGLFYLPRLFIYHAESADAAVRAQLKIMERRLLGITHIGGALAIVFGLWTLMLAPAFLHQAWLHAKLGLVACLIFYHGYLVRLKNRFARDEAPHSSRWLRIFNEVPALLLIAIVVLAVVKPG
jgi:putative membrane protein